METVDAILDQLWLLIVSFFTTLAQWLFTLTSLLHPFGAAVTISAVALLGVCLTKVLNRFIITRRYRELEAEFTYWHGIREEAASYQEREKGQRMARNIDQAKLNKLYYDYFFEGLLLGMARKVIPLFFLFAFVNEMYRPERMEQLFGRWEVFTLPATAGKPLLIGSVFWFFLSLLCWYLLWHIAAYYGKISPATKSG